MGLSGIRNSLVAGIFISAMAFAAPGGPGGPSPAPTAGIANVGNAASTLCTAIMEIIPIVSMLMIIGAGVVYAAGQIMGAETRARASQWATAMLIGAVIGILIVTVAPTILATMYGSATFKCTP